MASATGQLIVTEQELDRRLAFSLGLEPPLSRGDLTRFRLARRIVQVANQGHRDLRLAKLGSPKSDAAVDVVLRTTWIAQDLLLLGGTHRPPAYWEIGHYADFARTVALQNLRPSPTAVDELGDERWDPEQEGFDQLGRICHDISVWGVLKPLVDQGYAKAWGGEWGLCPRVPEGSDTGL